MRTRTEVLVVVPAGAHRTAEEHACRCVEALRWSGFDAEGMVGDADPAQAIEDALGLCDADVLVVDRSLADRARRRFGLPIVPVNAAA